MPALGPFHTRQIIESPPSTGPPPSPNPATALPHRSSASHVQSRLVTLKMNPHCHQSSLTRLKLHSSAPPPSASSHAQSRPVTLKCCEGPANSSRRSATSLSRPVKPKKLPPPSQNLAL